MKLIITTLVIAGNIFFISCKKDRTCSCKTETTTTTVTTPRGGGQASTTTNTSSGETDNTFSKVKKDDLTRLYNCNTRNETSLNTSTTLVTVYMVTTFAGVTYTTPYTYTADVASNVSEDYTCEIK